MMDSAFALRLSGRGLAAWLLASSLVACGGDAPPDTSMTTPVPPDPMEMGGGPMPDLVPQVSCSGVPDAGPKSPWRHGIVSPTVTALGSPKHRGIDLISGAAAVAQHVRGEISYGALDKALEDEQVDLFACRAGSWQRIGSTLTDDEGRFDLALSGAERLPLGQRPLYVSVAGDRTGVLFLGLVLPAGAPVVFSDVDGTLTSSENAFPESLVTGATVKVHDGAKDAYDALSARRYSIVYLTSRGRQFTEATRSWLRDVGLPAGPLRLAPQLLTFPGDATVDYKAGSMGEIAATGLKIYIGVGNRKSDGEAYQRASVAPTDIFLKQPEYKDETKPLIDRGEAVGFESYRELVPVFTALPLGR